MASSFPLRDQPLHDLLAFHNVARALTSSLELDSILRVIMSQMEQFFKPETWSLLIVDEKRHDLFFAVTAGHTMDETHDVRVPIGEGIAGWVAQHGETLIVPELGLDPRFNMKAQRRNAGSARQQALLAESAICIPLRARQKTLGVIQLFNCPLDRMTDHTISFLHVLCDYAAIAIENARAVHLIQELTITDDCTSLYNARYLYQKLEEELERSRRFRTPLSVIFIDLDHFKQINDRHGHLVGSRLLSDVGQSIRSRVRSIDLTFRYGGDEFVVLLPNTDRAQASEVARRLLEAMRSLNFAMDDELRLNVRASFGVATYPQCGSTVHEIISQADKAMYRVKNTTRDDVAAAAGDATFS